MHEVRLGEKGQVTLPKKIRDHYRLSKGDQVRMIDLGNGIMEVILLKHSRELPPPVIKAGKSVSIENMKEAAPASAADRYKRSRKRGPRDDLYFSGMSTLKVPIPPEFDAASEEQRIAFVQELWDRIAQDPDRVPVPDHHRQILDERLDAYRTNPQTGRPWNEVRDELLTKLRDS